jgi:hypothetical protein
VRSVSRWRHGRPSGRPRNDAEDFRFGGARNILPSWPSTPPEPGRDLSFPPADEPSLHHDRHRPRRRIARPGRDRRGPARHRGRVHADTTRADRRVARRPGRHLPPHALAHTVGRALRHRQPPGCPPDEQRLPLALWSARRRAPGVGARAPRGAGRAAVPSRHLPGSPQRRSRLAVRRATSRATITSASRSTTRPRSATRSTRSRARRSSTATRAATSPRPTWPRATASPPRARPAPRGATRSGSTRSIPLGATWAAALARVAADHATSISTARMCARIMPELDAVTAATPPGGEPLRIHVHRARRLGRRDATQVYVEVNTEGDYANEDWGPSTYPDPEQPSSTAIPSSREHWDYWATQLRLLRTEASLRSSTACRRGGRPWHRRRGARAHARWATAR